MLRGNPERFSIDQIRALADAEDSVVSRAFVERLKGDERRAARELAGRLERRFAREDAERDRRERMTALERRCWEGGATRVAGVDEVGMGPLAGPVVAAAVILDPRRLPHEVDDSKVLDAATRERLALQVKETALAHALGVATVDEIAERDVYQAGLLAMRRAVEALSPSPDRVLVDARTIPGLAVPQEAHVKGDARSVSIAAASVVAKVHRDALMAELAQAHPGYGFDRHSGYSTPEHLEALRRLGPCPAHRTAWSALADHAGTLGDEFYRLKAALRAVDSGDSWEGWRSAVQAAVARLGPQEVRRLDALARRRPWASAPQPASAPRLPLG